MKTSKYTVIKIRQAGDKWKMWCVACNKSHVEKDGLARALFRARRHGKLCNGQSDKACNCSTCRQIRRNEAEDLIKTGSNIIVIYK